MTNWKVSLKIVHMVHMNNLEGFIYNLFVRSDLLDVLQPFSY